MNNITISGMPPHRLILKVGCVVMLLRNLDPTRGLCNGTRLLVSSLTNSKFRIHCTILDGGPYKGESVSLFRIDIVPDTRTIGFEMTRRQFPIRLCYAMTINKSQGKTIDKVGVYLPQPVFTHGQFYVAMSRCGIRTALKCYVKCIKTVQGKLISRSTRTFTRNIVYKEVL